MKNAKTGSNKYAWAIATGCVLITIIWGSLAKAHLYRSQLESDYIYSVDQVPVGKAEFMKSMRANRAFIVDYFNKKYGAEQTPAFWSTNFDGEIPLNTLKQKALDESLRIKVQQIMAQEQGVLEHIDYSDFLRDLETENERRQQAINQNQVVYGPAQYNEDTYFEYVLSNAKISVKKNLQHQMGEANHRELKQFYDRMKNKLYVSAGSVKVQRITLSFLDANHEVDQDVKDAMKRKMEEIKAKLTSGSDFKQLAVDYHAEGAAGLLQFEANQGKHNLKSPMAQEALKMKLHEVSNVIEENGSYTVMKCIEKREAGLDVSPFEEMKEQVLQDYIEYKYESEVQKRISAAQVVINSSQYEAVQVFD